MKTILMLSFVFFFVSCSKLGFLSPDHSSESLTGKTDEDEDDRDDGDPEPLPSEENVSSSMDSVDEAIPKMWVSEDFGESSLYEERVVATDELADVEIDALEDFIENSEVSNDKKRIIFARYFLGYERYTEALIAAKKAGIEVQIIIDLNLILSGHFGSDQKTKSKKYTSDFAKASYKSGVDELRADTLKAFLKSEEKGGPGMLYSTHIFSQPLYNTDRVNRVPVLHDKYLILMSDKDNISQGNIEVYFGSNNIINLVRVNRMLKTVDATLCKAFVSHAENLMKTYKAGKPTSESDVMSPLRITYNDGSSVEFAATDGKYNPNERIRDLLDANRSKLKSATFSHFALTYQPALKSLKEALSESLDAQVTFLTDDRFAAFDQDHLALVLEEVNPWTVFDSSSWYFPMSLADRIEIKILQDLNAYKKTFIVDKDIPQVTRKNFHDKLTILEIGDNSVAAYFGSLNLSNAFKNSDIQVEILADGSSELVQSLKESVTNFIANGKNSVVDGASALFRNAIGAMMKTNGHYLALDSVENVLAAVRNRDYDKIVSEFENITANYDSSITSLSESKYKVRAKQFLKLINWYYTEKNLPESKDSTNYRLRRFLGLVYLVSNSEMKSKRAKMILRSLLKREGMSKNVLNSLVSTAYQIVNR